MALASSATLHRRQRQVQVHIVSTETQRHDILRTANSQQPSDIAYSSAGVLYSPLCPSTLLLGQLPSPTAPRHTTYQVQCLIRHHHCGIDCIYLPFQCTSAQGCVYHSLMAFNSFSLHLGKTVSSPMFDSACTFSSKVRCLIRNHITLGLIVSISLPLSAQGCVLHP